MEVKISHLLMLLTLILLNHGCTSLTVNKSIAPVAGNGWSTSAREVNDIAQIDFYGEYGKFGSGALFRCDNNTIIVYPIPVRYSSVSLVGFLGIPFIPLFMDAEQRMRNYEVIKNMDGWNGRLYVALRYYKTLDPESLEPVLKLKNNPKTYNALEWKKSEYNNADVIVFLFDIMLDEVDNFSIRFGSKDSDCKLPDIKYEKSSIFIYKPIVAPMP